MTSCGAAQAAICCWVKTARDEIHSDSSDAVTARIQDWSGSERDGQATFIVTLSHASDQAVTIQYQTQALSGTTAAISGHDYASASGNTHDSSGPNERDDLNSRVR